ncbi:putative 1-deoxy-D-xylulose-5-phosphate synthase [Nymphaea thermarum]|nr:putative 1-deoxy-D-xylulose-5-phosphate synthase [Nymphaea thermarum]
MGSALFDCPTLNRVLVQARLESSASRTSSFPVHHSSRKRPSFLRKLLSDTALISPSKVHVNALPEFDDFFWEKAPTPLLDLIETPIQLKNLSLKDLKQLADEIRSEMSFVLSKTQKTLNCSLAAVELTVAIHYVFHAPMDKILWDVGEEAYAHKILTGRRSRLHTLRQRDGISGYTSRFESEYDAFGAGHGCNSISAGLGMAAARDLKGKKDCIVTVISNGTTMAGQVYEAMNNAGYLDSNMVVILNDTRHSLQQIRPENAPKMSVNILSSTLSKIQSSKSFRRFREALKGITKRFGQGMYQWAAKVDEYARGMIGPPGSTLFEELGLYYIGPVDGHNIKDLVCVLQEVASLESTGPVLVHVITDEGRGTDIPRCGRSFLKVYSNMGRFTLVIFLTTQYVVQDVDLQRLPVRFAITSAGLVGSDGPALGGAFDITYMACLPNMIVMAPSDEIELIRMVATAARIDDRPVCFRYPRGAIVELRKPPFCSVEPLEIGKGNVVAEGQDVALLGYGVMVHNCLQAKSLLANLGVQITVADARFCKPLDIELLRQLCRNHEFLITVEEGTVGGFGSHVAQFLALDGQLDGMVKWRPIVLPDKYIGQASPREQLSMAGLTGHHIAATVLSLLGRPRDALHLMT